MFNVGAGAWVSMRPGTGQFLVRVMPGFGSESFTMARTGLIGPIIDNYDVLFRALSEGQGVGLLMLSVGAEQIAEAKLAIPLGIGNAVEFVYNLYYPHGALEYPIIRDFRQWLIDEASDLEK